MICYVMLCYDEWLVLQFLNRKNWGYEWDILIQGVLYSPIIIIYMD
jgi:hypothetical protein